MSKIHEVMMELPEDVREGMRKLALVARDPTVDAVKRLEACCLLGDLGGPLLMESFRRELLEVQEPKYEYRFVRGAKVKVRIK